MFWALVFSAIANPSICDNTVNLDMEKPVDMCYFQLANLKNEFLICNNIQDDYLKGECYSELASYVTNPQECADLKNPRGNKDFTQLYYDRTVCYTNVAQYTGNLSWCLYAGPKDKEECVENVGKEPVILGEDKENTINQCVERINFSRNECLIKIAKKNQNESICNLLLESPVNINSICLDDVARVKLDGSNCKSIYCVKEVAISQNNQSFCREINNTKYIVNVAELSFDDSYKKSSDEEWRELTSNECFNKIIENLTLEVLQKIKTSNIDSPNDPRLILFALELKDIWRGRIPFDLIYSLLEKKNLNETYRDLLLIDAVGTFEYKQMMDIHTSRRFIQLFKDAVQDEKNNYPILPKTSMLHELTGLHITAEEKGYNPGIGEYKFFLESLKNKYSDPLFSSRLNGEINTINNFYPNISVTEPMKTPKREN